MKRAIISAFPLSLLIIGMFTSAFDFQLAKASPDSDWLGGWNYRKSHAINPELGAGTNYQVRIIAHSGYGSDNGENVYLDGCCVDFPNDVRFTDNDGINLLDHWLESSNNSTAAFWVEVQDSLSNTSATVYIYYGKSGESSASNGDSTFLLFDSFSGISLNTNKWNSSTSLGSLSVSNDILTLNGASSGISGNNGIVSLTDFSSQKALETRIKYTNIYGHYAYRQVGFSGASAAGTPIGRAHILYCQETDAWGDPNADLPFSTHTTHGPGTYTKLTQITTWHVQSIYWRSDETQIRRNYGSALATHTTGVPSGNLSVVAGAGNNAYSNAVQIDWIRVRKYVSPEPTHGGWGNKETIPHAVGGNATLIIIPATKLELLAPYIGLTALLAVAVTTVIYAKKRKSE